MRIKKLWLPEPINKPKLLIVDDEPLNIRILHELLRDQFDIFMAANGSQAITKAQAILPDLILLDVVMPDINGYEVCKTLKSDPTTEDIPIIFITAHFDEAEEVLGFEAGAADFIRKPINPIITKTRIYSQITLKQQRDLLLSIALTDNLTGIANRRKFDEALLSEWQQSSRDKSPLSLLLLDIDFFKQYNDIYGHVIGDSCLQLVAFAIKKSMQRPYDLVARYGGEEFVCILPKTDLKGAIYIAELILSNIRELNITHDGSSINSILTASIGAACIHPTAHIQPIRLIDAADQQLYQSKHNGRARVSAVEL